MINRILLSFIICFSSLIWASGNQANYTIEPGKYHSGGSASALVLDNSSDHYSVLLSYKIIKKKLVPIPNQYLSGDDTFVLPTEFSDEKGYLELEEKGEIKIDDAKIKFLGRCNYKEYSNAYKLIIYPNNGRSEIVVIYHPSIPSVGWGYVEITLKSSLAIINNYKITLDIKP